MRNGQHHIPLPGMRAQCLSCSVAQRPGSQCSGRDEMRAGGGEDVENLGARGVVSQHG